MRRVNIDWKTYLKPPFHSEGKIFVGIAALITLVLLTIGGTFWLLVGLILTTFVLYFFRNPRRMVPDKPGLVVAPASGIVQAIGEVEPPAELGLEGGKRVCVSIFLSVFDVHVNRVPVGGTVTKIVYTKGKTMNAAFDKASEENERNAVVVKTADNRQVAFTQIAGQIARRIRCDIKENQTVLTGDVMGLIRFGSKVDILLPPGVNPTVVPGQTMISGETVIADLNSKEAAWTAVQR
ncbi:phosphatidylserine decarboxylase [Phaeovibrio sulfidiphilus]|uniref:Phosphatidylserine decarboxylase proenzyme n=1 Tax=Phaeovibrio sulfidiphilus TaxID=1220600 RepID=A0A8J7CVS1_9PROT|nr:phosphatidylserine decarboxylase [Phaeovibrio sulfidiphilus]MBE1236631.1 phosphatidylserine decarboxylase [Phaeovibrio sulfidiphilus]